MVQWRDVNIQLGLRPIYQPSGWLPHLPPWQYQLPCATWQIGSELPTTLDGRSSCHGPWQDGRSTDPGLSMRVSLVAFVPYLLLAAISRFDDGHKLSASEGERRCSLRFERVHRSFESRKGDLEHNTRKGCFWPGRPHLDAN